MVGGFGLIIRSTTGIPIPSPVCTRKLDEDFTDRISSPERSERDFRRAAGGDGGDGGGEERKEKYKLKSFCRRSYSDPVATQRYSVEDFQTLYLMNQSQATVLPVESLFVSAVATLPVVVISSRKMNQSQALRIQSLALVQDLEKKKQAKRRDSTSRKIQSQYFSRSAREAVVDLNQQERSS
ncbi:hypothetical protein F511_24499 [Dorcoceras hygrometricum]|uniref:Uncharacterized protein n=1 Tax=Dorcoceras hygrometricum TaxID=472368 RepID=A0A2Z7BIE4_9LAMI|nr:hypothetical protein F511_24499 [Dorcoceras hygrometricum]